MNVNQASNSSILRFQDSIGEASQSETAELTGPTKPERSKVSVREEVRSRGAVCKKVHGGDRSVFQFVTKGRNRNRFTNRKEEER